MAQENVVSTEHQNGGAKNSTAKVMSFSALKPQLVVQAPRAADAVQFYKSAFGAAEVKRTMHPKKKAEQDLPLILSAELKLGSAVLLVYDGPEETAIGVKLTVNQDGSTLVLSLEMIDFDGAVAKAIETGAVVDEEIAEGVGGGCCRKVKDPFGFIWPIGSKAADVEA